MLFTLNQLCIASAAASVLCYGRISEPEDVFMKAVSVEDETSSSSAGIHSAGSCGDDDDDPTDPVTP